MNIDEDTGKAHVQVRRRGAPELFEVIDRSPAACAQEPETTFGIDPRGYWHRPRPQIHFKQQVQGGTFANYTRIWMAATPPVGLDPGYACVVGEVFDGHMRAQERKLYLLDECADAILQRLFRKIAALKDIYWPTQLLVDPKHEQFCSDLIKARWCISHYPDEEEVPDDEVRQHNPHFVSRERIASLGDVPYKEDDEWGFIVVDTLFSEGIFSHHECCQIFAESQYQTPHRAVAICLLGMMTYEWTEEMNDQQDHDGYDLLEDIPEEGDEMEAHEAAAVAMLYAVGDTMDRRALERNNFRIYTRRDPEENRYVEEDGAPKKEEDWSWLNQ